MTDPSALTLHGMAESAGTRLCLWAAACNGAAVRFERVDLWAGDHLGDSFKALTRGRSCIPFLSQGTTGLSESRAIANLLLDQGPGRAVPPTHEIDDPWRRARVEELVQFDLGVLYPRLTAFAYPILFNHGDMPAPDGEEAEKLRKAVAFLRAHLEGHDFLTGSTPTLADLAICTTLTMSLCVPSQVFDLESYPDLIQWFTRCREVGGGEYGAICAPFLEYAAAKIEAFQKEMRGESKDCGDGGSGDEVNGASGDS